MKTNLKTQLNTLKYFLIAGFFFLALVNGAQAAVVTKEEIIKLVNQERKQAGLNELVESAVLDQAAELKAQDMLGNNYFAHTSPQGVSPWHWFEEAKYQYKYAGENLGMDFSSAGSVHRAWMKSPTHKENIMSSKYQEIGVAVREGVFENKETQVAVQLFGTQLSAENQALLTAIQKENQDNQVQIKEASVSPWKETQEDEMLVYAKVSGSVQKVEVVLGQNQYELLKHRDNVYMNLFQLKELNLESQDVAIRAYGESGEPMIYQIPKEKLEKYNKEPLKEEKKEQIVIASANQGGMLNLRQLMQQNIFLSSGLVVFLVVVANIWVLEKEEEKLLAACQ